MKRLIVIATLSAFVTSLMFQPASAKEIQLGNLKLTLPDEITVTGNEVGTEPRSCLYKVRVESNPGTTIPLRGGVNVILRDSLGATIDTGASQATVEGLTVMEIPGVFRCDASTGTLKPPYTFQVIAMNLPNVGPFLEPVPVKLTFVAPAPKIAPTPTPTPTPVPSPVPTLSTATAISESEAVAIAQVDELRAKLSILDSQLRRLQSALSKANQKINRICSAKPRPKGC